jgi:hypothetical protein
VLFKKVRHQTGVVERRRMIEAVGLLRVAPFDGDGQDGAGQQRILRLQRRDPRQQGEKGIQRPMVGPAGVIWMPPAGVAGVI